MNKPGASNGFSLLEMLVVLAVISLAASVTYTGMNWRKPRESLSTLSHKIVHEAAVASLRAISKGETASVRVNVANRVLSAGQAGSDIIVPEPFKITILTGVRLIEQGQAGIIEFYSDGTSSGGEIVLEDGSGRTSSVRIYWLTGAITIESGVRP